MSFRVSLLGLHSQAGLTLPLNALGHKQDPSSF